MADTIRKRIILAALLSIVVLLGVSCADQPTQPTAPPAAPPTRQPVATLRTIGPYVYVNKLPAQDGASLSVGDEVSTGSGSSAYIDFLDGGYVQLDQNTDPRIFRDGNRLCVELKTGQMFADKSPLCFGLPDLAGLLNSRVNFRVTRAESIVTVHEGRVELFSPGAMTIGGGQEARVTHGEQRMRIRALSDEELRESVQWRQNYALSGWCCRGGRVDVSDHRACDGSEFFYSREAALARCRPIPPVITSSAAPPVQPPAPPPPVAAPARIVYFRAEPPTVEPGQPTNLCYAVENAVRVTVEPLNGGPFPPGRQCRPVRIEGRQTFRLRAYARDGTYAEQSMTIEAKRKLETPQSAVIESFSAEPSGITQGASSALCYRVRDAVSVTIQPNVGAIQPGRQQCVQVQPQETTVYTLTAVGLDRKAVLRRVTVAVTSAQGWCCVRPGQLTAMPATQCRQKEGVWYKDQKTGNAKCVPRAADQPPIQKGIVERLAPPEPPPVK